MHFGQKLAFFALGCAFVVASQVLLALVTPKAVAQGDTRAAEYDEITVRKLRAVDDEGRVRVIIGAEEIELEHVDRNHDQEALVQVFNRLGAPVMRVAVVVSEANTGGKGRLTISNSDGLANTLMASGYSVISPEFMPMASLSVSSDTAMHMMADNEGGVMFLESNSLSLVDSGSSINLTCPEDGGRVAVGKVVNGVGGTRAVMSVTENGGTVAVQSSVGEQIWANLTTNEYGGEVNVWGPGNGNGATLDVGIHGGRLAVFGKGSSGARAAVAVNEYGNGAVGRWDKDGYRLE